MPTPFYTDDPPLNSDCRWFCIDVLTQLLVERLCSPHDAALDMHEALLEGSLRCMARTGLERRLLAPEEWAALQILWCTDETNTRFWFEVAYRETNEPFSCSCYVWKPDFDALWGLCLQSLDPVTAEPSKVDIDPPSEKVPTPEPSIQKAKTRRGRREYDIWDPMIDHLVALAKTRGRRFATLTEAADYGLVFLEQFAKERRKEGNGAAMPAPKTIQAKIRDRRPDLVCELISSSD